jgi:hypothetical protein
MVQANDVSHKSQLARTEEHMSGLAYLHVCIGIRWVGIDTMPPHTPFSAILFGYIWDCFALREQRWHRKQPLASCCPI